MKDYDYTVIIHAPLESWEFWLSFDILAIKIGSSIVELNGIFFTRVCLRVACDAKVLEQQWHFRHSQFFIFYPLKPFHISNWNNHYYVL